MTEDQLFEGAPPVRWERSLGLRKPGQPLVERRALLAALIGWLPLAVLAAATLLAGSEEAAKSFFSDFAVHARYLLAVPALIFAEADCVPRFGRIVNHFREAGLVFGSDTERFHAAVASTRRLLDSTIGHVVTVVLAYLGVAAVVIYAGDAVPVWHRGDPMSASRFSLAGWAHVLVSLPLLLVVFLGWLWRLVLWARFLFLMSRLDLRLIPGHPDRLGGLKFVSSSLRGFRLFSFGCGAIVAGTVLNRQVHQGTNPLDFTNLVWGLLIVLVILSAGPLTVFLSMLRSTKRRGVFEYGALARAIGTQFEERWLRHKATIDETSLEVRHFSTTTDLYSVTENVYGMRELPFAAKDLIGPIVLSAMLPFLPVALMAMPLEVIVQAVMKLLV